MQQIDPSIDMPHSARLALERRQDLITVWLAPNPGSTWPPLRPEAPQPM